MKRYTFDTPQTMAVLHDGRTRVFFDEQKGEEIHIIIYPDGTKKEEARVIYTYRAVELPAGVVASRETITGAIIREDYFRDEVEAIFRHMLAGAKSAAEEFDKYNAAAIAAEKRAEEIINTKK